MTRVCRERRPFCMLALQKNPSRVQSSEHGRAVESTIKHKTYLNGGHTGIALDYWPTGQAIDPAPGA